MTVSNYLYVLIASQGYSYVGTLMGARFDCKVLIIVVSYHSVSMQIAKTRGSAIEAEGVLKGREGRSWSFILSIACLYVFFHHSLICR